MHPVAWSVNHELPDLAAIGADGAARLPGDPPADRGGRVRLRHGQRSCTPPFAVAECETQIVDAVSARCEDRWELAGRRREYHRPREDLEILKRAAAIFTAATRSAQPFVEAESLNSKVRQSGKSGRMDCRTARSA